MRLRNKTFYCNTRKCFEVLVDMCFRSHKSWPMETSWQSLIINCWIVSASLRLEISSVQWNGKLGNGMEWDGFPVRLLARFEDALSCTASASDPLGFEWRPLELVNQFLHSLAPSTVDGDISSQMPINGRRRPAHALYALTSSSVDVHLEKIIKIE